VEAVQQEAPGAVMGVVWTHDDALDASDSRRLHKAVLARVNAEIQRHVDAVDEAMRAAEADMEDGAAWREKKALRDAALDALDKVVMEREREESERSEGEGESEEEEESESGEEEGGASELGEESESGEEEGGVRSQKKPEFDHAYSYVSKIKQRFATQKDVYEKFLQVKESLTRALRAP
jgi:hypothetical protein